MGAHRRRALALGLPAETFSRTEVFDRDSWMCGLCREPVAKSRRYPDLMSPTIDHIVPMVLGGGHTRANTQCAHFLCNSLKGQSLEVPSNFDALLAEGLERFDSALQLAAVIYP
jgi:5-methylcytosine-specific restriction endonuclease McrA